MEHGLKLRSQDVSDNNDDNYDILGLPCRDANRGRDMLPRSACLDEMVKKIVQGRCRKTTLARQ